MQPTSATEVAEVVLQIDLCTAHFCNIIGRELCLAYDFKKTQFGLTFRRRHS